MSRILLVEDDQDLADRVVKWLTMDRHSVEHVANGRDALEFLEARTYDIIVLDWQLPEVQGIDILRQYRATGGNTPVLMLTGKGEITDKESGLDAGADDYLTKPFHPRELSARLRALARRPVESVSDQLKAGNIVLQPSTFTVTRDGDRIDLLPLEFALMEFFMRNPGRVFPAEALLERVWPVNSEASPEAVRTVIKTLRKKIDRDGEQSVIRTIHGVGYKLEPPQSKA